MLPVGMHADEDAATDAEVDDVGKLLVDVDIAARRHASPVEPDMDSGRCYLATWHADFLDTSSVSEFSF